MSRRDHRLVELISFARPEQLHVFKGGNRGWLIDAWLASIFQSLEREGHRNLAGTSGNRENLVL